MIIRVKKRRKGRNIVSSLRVASLENRMPDTLKALPLPFRMIHGEFNNRVLATQGTENASLRKSKYIPCR